MNHLLTADLHLTDNPIEDYRWHIFNVLEEHALKNEVSLIGMLGDTFDRKDRHTGNLVNRFVDKILDLQNRTRATIIILPGNHDAPLKGTFFWEFLNKYNHISYVTKPRPFYTHAKEHIWLLPFSPNPIAEWEHLPFWDAMAIFMHQPVQGVTIDGTRVLSKAPELPPFPDIPIFSGDIHHQQTFNGVTYIGVPHPVHFGESWRNRILLVKDNDFKNFQEIWVDYTKRAILTISSFDELKATNFSKGDQLRIRYQLDGTNLTNWALEEEKIRNWAIEKGIYLASVEAVIIGEGLKAATEEEINSLELMQPEQVVEQFCKDEKLSKEVLDIGLELVRGAL